MHFLGRWFITFIATWVAVEIVPGISLPAEANFWLTLAIFSFVLSLINASIKPILQVLSIPITVITLGLFYLVVNALLLMLADWLTSVVFAIPVGMSFGSAFLASIIISLVSTVVSAITGLRD